MLGKADCDYITSSRSQGSSTSLAHCFTAAAGHPQQVTVLRDSQIIHSYPSHHRRLRHRKRLGLALIVGTRAACDLHLPHDKRTPDTMSSRKKVLLKVLELCADRSGRY